MYVVNIAEIKAIDAINMDNLSPGLSFIFFFAILSFFFICANDENMERLEFQSSQLSNRYVLY